MLNIESEIRYSPTGKTKSVDRAREIEGWNIEQVKNEADWHGMQLLNNPSAAFNIRQWEPYDKGSSEADISPEDSLNAIITRLEKTQQTRLEGVTQLMIVPGYKFRMTDGMVTNFHQPQSTLLLLIAAFLGNSWKEVYDHALSHDYRLLSYGDSCLFL